MSAAEDGQARKTLVALYEAAVAAAHPDLCLPRTCRVVPKAGRLIVVGAGKAAAAMALVMEAHYRRLGSLDRVLGFTTAPYCYGRCPAVPTRGHRGRAGAASHPRSK